MLVFEIAGPRIRLLGGSMLFVVSDITGGSANVTASSIVNNIGGSFMPTDTGDGSSAS